MKRKTVCSLICLCILIFSVLVLEFSSSPQQFNDILAKGSSSSADGWLTGWQYRREQVVIKTAGAGTNYQVEVKTYYGNASDSTVSFAINVTNAANPSISNAGYLAENIVYDNVTGKYWWIFEDRSSYPTVIRMASATSLNGSWTVESNPVINESGHDCRSPFIAQFGSTWYIYYCRVDNVMDIPGDIWVQESSSVNTGYNASGISNPVLARGAGIAWDDLRDDEPYVFLDNGTYYLFYMGQNSTTHIEQTGYATSSSPSGGFVKYVANPILPADGWPHGWDSGMDRATDPFVYKSADGTYWIGVSGVSNGESLTGEIGFYTSRDLVNFTSYSANPVLRYGVSGNWDSVAVIRGALMNFNGTLYLSYAGYNGSNWRCGLTTLTIYKANDNEQVFLNGKCRTDFGDIRFTGSDGTSLLNYWMENKTDGNQAVFWVQVAGNLSASDQTIYLYYGNSFATTTSSGNGTFQFFDDFRSGNMSSWKVIRGTWNEANGSLNETASASEYSIKANFTDSGGLAYGFMGKYYGSWNPSNAMWLAIEIKSPYTEYPPYEQGYLCIAYGTGSGGWPINTMKIFRLDAGVPTQLAAQPVSISPDTWYKYEVTYFANNISFYLNGAKELSATDSLYSNGAVLRLWVSNTQGEFSDLFVRKYVDPQPALGSWGTEETDDQFQMTFGFYDLDSNNFTSRVTWQLFNGTQLLNYTEGQSTLRSGTYTLKTMIGSYVIDTRNLDTPTYGNSTANITLNAKQQNSTLDGYVALNCTVSSLTIQSQTATNLTFTVSASPGTLFIKVPHNAEYIKKDGLYVQTWTVGLPTKSNSPRLHKLNVRIQLSQRYILADSGHQDYLGTVTASARLTTV